MLLTKEDKQLVTKSKMIALTEVFALCNYLVEADQTELLADMTKDLNLFGEDF